MLAPRHRRGACRAHATVRAMTGPTIAGRGARVGVLAVGAAAAVLLLANLDSPYLWQDEAQTALIAETVLAGGLPRGTDGTNFFSQELGVEYGPDHLWRWHTWLPFYLAAGFFAVLSPGTASARLPFALLGVATVLLVGATARRWWRAEPVAIASALLLASSVPFLLLHRQARWYAAASFASLLALYLYGRLDGSRAAAFGLAGALLLLFHSHYLYAATLLAALLVHAALLERQRLRTTIRVAAAVALLCAPWLWWLSGIELGERYAARLGDWEIAVRQTRYYGARFFGEILEPLFALAPILLLADRWRRGLPLWTVSPATRSHAALLLLFVGTTILALGTAAPGSYFRYLAPLVAPAFLLIGLAVGSLWARSRIAAAALVGVWWIQASLGDFAYELTHDFDGPIEGIVGFLQTRAEPGDTVAITYGDLPLKFYTDLRVLGGLTGEDTAGAADARFIIVRRHRGSPEERRLAEVFGGFVRPATHRPIAIPYPDTAFENREDPALHRFRSERPTFPRVVIFEARR